MATKKELEEIPHLLLSKNEGYINISLNACQELGVKYDDYVKIKKIDESYIIYKCDETEGVKIGTKILRIFDKPLLDELISFYKINFKEEVGLCQDERKIYLITEPINYNGIEVYKLTYEVPARSELIKEYFEF